MHSTTSQEYEVHFASLKITAFGSSGWKVATEVFSANVGKKVHFGPGLKIGIFYTCMVKKVHFGSSGLEVATLQHKWGKESTLWLRLGSRNFSVQA